jgi:hypothetical protein
MAVCAVQGIDYNMSLLHSFYNLFVDSKDFVQVNGQAVVMTLLKKPSTETIGIKEFSASCDLGALCNHIDSVSFLYSQLFMYQFQR